MINEDESILDNTAILYKELEELSRFIDQFKRDKLKMYFDANGDIYKHLYCVVMNVKSAAIESLNLFKNYNGSSLFKKNATSILRYLKIKISSLFSIFSEFDEFLYLENASVTNIPMLRSSDFHYVVIGNGVIALKDDLLEEFIKLFVLESKGRIK